MNFRTKATTIEVEGYASTFGDSYDMGWYKETVTRGAFTKTLQSSPDVRFLVNHEGLPLARTASGTLRLDEDKRGLHVSATFDATDPDVRRIVPKMQRGDLNQMSFAFGIVKDEWTEKDSKRNLTELSLAGGDVSVVTYPANPNASIALRAKKLLTKHQTRVRQLHAELITGEYGTARSARTLDILENLGHPATLDDDDLRHLIRALGKARNKHSVSAREVRASLDALTR